jgi:hexosaminidase
VGAWRKETAGYPDRGEKSDNTPHGGFYSQDDVREIVAYAAERHITVIPEIELPGHSGAAIAAYPWLSCTPDEPKEVVTTWGVKEDVFCPSPKTFEFLEGVFDEVLELFPSPYYHIGGDECPKEAWRASKYCHHLADSLGLSSVDDLQYYFVKHFDTYLRERGKTVIGWDEILDGSAVPSTVVMSYRGHAPASRAFAKDMKVILAPNRWCYYDYDQEEIEDKFKNHHLFITLRKAYLYDYMKYLNPEVADKAEDLLLGVQACVWGEYIPDIPKLHQQTYPRSATIAEVTWTADSSRNWDDFRLRLGKEFERLEAKGVNYSKAYWQVIVNMNLESKYPREVELELDYPYAVIRYTTDGSEPTAESPLAPRYMTVNKGDVIKARGFMPDGTPVGTTMSRTFGK